MALSVMLLSSYIKQERHFRYTFAFRVLGIRVQGKNMNTNMSVNVCMDLKIVDSPKKYQ